MTDQTPPQAILSSDEELTRRSSFHQHFRASPLPPGEQLSNLGLFLNRQSLSRILSIEELYTQILDVPGVVMEFGVRWGQNLALFSNFRGIHEPFNYTRKIVGFDTFEGFPGVHPADGSADSIQVGAYGVTEGFDGYLDKVLDYHEHESPLSHMRKYELVKGDVTHTVPDYLQTHPETVVALAYFDLDLYEPTRDCLLALAPHLTRGSVLAFDELNHPGFPGETTAVREVLGLNTYRLRRSKLSGYASWLVID